MGLACSERPDEPNTHSAEEHKQETSYSNPGTYPFPLFYDKQPTNPRSLQ